MQRQKCLAVLSAKIAIVRTKYLTLIALSQNVSQSTKTSRLLLHKDLIHKDKSFSVWLLGMK